MPTQIHVTITLLKLIKQSRICQYKILNTRLYYNSYLDDVIFRAN